MRSEQSAMGEEARMTEHDAGDEQRVSEWELGLPSSDDLTPLSQCLIPLELASAFSISPEPHRTMDDVNRASENTLSSIRGQSNGLNSFKSFDGGERDEGESDPRKIRKIEVAEEAEKDDDVSKTLKRPRLVWTPQLHKRFVDVVAHLGIKNAVPKTIMQLMNVEGLTRENVASHLQKYRLYLKRMQGLSNEGPSSSDHLFASTPVPQSLNEPGGGGQAAMPVPVPIPVPYPQMMHMPMSHGAYPWMQQVREASGNYKFGSVGSYRHLQHPGSNDN